jgi:hypothetical protein
MEDFWGFNNPVSQNGQGLPEHILQQLCFVLNNNFTSLIAQTYDGAAVMSGEKGGVQTIIKNIIRTLILFTVMRIS